MSGTPDIDIDFADRTAAMDALYVVPSMIDRNGRKTAHPSGVYFQDAPVDPFTNLCSLDYKEADKLGYFKIDFLNQSVYANVRDEDHLVTLLNSDPMWELLDEEVFVDELPHIKGHFDIVQSISPKSIEDLAVVLALIRPGKRHLVGKHRSEIDNEVWNLNNTEGYSFRKAHAISYAALIAVRMNLLTQEWLSQLEQSGSLELEAHEGDRPGFGR